MAIFDFDGTLADSGAVVLKLVNPMARMYGFKCVTDEEVEMLRGRPNREIIKYLGVSPWKIPLIAAHGKKLMAAEIGAITLFPGVPDMLKALAAGGVRLAVVSSNSEATIRTVLGPDLAGLIDHYGCGASLFGKAKKFLKVIKTAGVTPGRVISIGDETRDIDAANALGLASGAVTWGYATRQLLVDHTPTVLLDAVDDIVSRLTAQPEVQAAAVPA
ncbi:HAD hydrolase-like protein [Caulobacter hibisci]|uniref:HAD hydrolase-like protein n=1 Tax=Caulobacter hibisci TaxID=2035993 RepID=A0ABS0SUT1_9CAUL|nr:HAD hydrolase-like protein [Caulobacter hibisci]MBI1683159.1 HAD hydrolase-like protein [Caulobacter hibisci]